MNINFYNHYFLNYKEKYTSKYILSLMILLILILIILFIPFSNNKVFKGQIIKSDNKYLVLLSINYDEINYISDKCIIDYKKYECHISKIERQGYNYLILLNIKLEKRYLIENYPIDIEINRGRETLYQKIKKGWDIWK